MHTLVIVYTLLHVYMYITAEIHLDERAFASCSFHDMTLQKFRRFYFSFFCYKKTGNSFMWVDMMTWQCWKFLLGWKVKSNKSVYSDIRLCFFFINKIVFCVMGKKKGTDDSLKKWTRDKLRCIYILQQGGGFPGAGSGLASWLWEEWLSSLENFKQLKIDKIPFHTLSFYKSRLITFVSLRPVAATVSQSEHQRLLVSSWSNASSQTRVCVWMWGVGGWKGVLFRCHPASNYTPDNSYYD